MGNEEQLSGLGDDQYEGKDKPQSCHRKKTVQQGRWPNQWVGVRVPENLGRLALGTVLRVS